MIRHFRSICLLMGSLSALSQFPSLSHAQIAYGVNSLGTLFHFDLNHPADVTTVGSIGFVPAGMDFRPGTNQLYAIGIRPSTSQIYRIDIATAVPTPVGPDFTTAGTGYNFNLGPESAYGFDFDPKSLQPDGSMRIRFASTFGYNVQFNSSTGQMVTQDHLHNIPGSFNDTWIEALAYINNIPEMGGTTKLYAIDSVLDDLYLMDPPASGQLHLVGPLGGTGFNPISNINFDVYTDPNDTDPGTVGDKAYAVMRDVSGGAQFKLYNISLTTGDVGAGQPVGSPSNPIEFTGGFAILPAPEPSSLLLICLGAMSAAIILRVRRL